MNRLALPKRRPGLRTLLLAATLAAAPLPATAGTATATQPTSPVGIHAQGQAIVAAQVLAATPGTAATVRGSVVQTDLGSRSFFKTPAGIVTLVAIAAGVGFALYSSQHDRVKSPGR